MTEPVSSSSSSSSPTGMTIDIRPMIEDVSQVMTKHITNILTGVIGEYTIYKETHDTIMGLPCVRKLQQRIAELENGGEAYMNASEPAAAAAATATGSNSRQDEVAQLQAAIAEMNRYIAALESKVNSNSKAEPITADEESVKLEIHEEDVVVCEEKSAGESFTVSSTHKNVIVSALADDTVAEDAEEDAEPVEEEEAAEEEAVEEEAAEEEAAEEEEAAAEEAEEEEAEEEAAEEAAEEEAEEEAAEEEAEEEEAEEEEADEEEAAEEEEAEADEEEAAAAEEAEAEEEAEIEVSEVKIKGKTYFTTDPQNGIIYACVDDDVGDEVGVFKNGIAVFNKSKK